MLLIKAPSHCGDFTLDELPDDGALGGRRCTVTPFSVHAATTASRTLPFSTPSSAVYTSCDVGVSGLRLS